MAKRKRTKKRLSWLFPFIGILLCSVVIVLILRGISRLGEIIDEYLYFPTEETEKTKDAENSQEPEKLLYQQYVTAASHEFDVPESVIYAVIYCESNFDAQAVSAVGAKGLMQMMPATFREMQGYLKETHSEDALLNPEISIRYGTYYLSRMYKHFGNWETAFAAYNAGPTIVSKWLKDAAYSTDGKTLSHIPYSETAHYVKKVSGMVEKYKEYSQTEVQK